MAVLVLVLGDLHIPLRSHDLPAKFKKLLVQGKIQQIVSTGNLCDRETYEYLRGIAPDVRGVRGDYDEHGPLRIGVLHGHQLVPLGDTDALSAVARKMDVDVLISGGTHRFETFEYDGRFFINPGSATGAFSPHWAPTTTSPLDAASDEADGATKAIESESAAAEGSGTALASNGATEGTKTSSLSTYPPSPTPSFALLDIQGMVVVTYVYKLVDGEVRVEKLSFRKK